MTKPYLANGGGSPPLFSPPPFTHAVYPSLFTHPLIHNLSRNALSDGSIYCVVVMKKQHHTTTTYFIFFIYILFFFYIYIYFFFYFRFSTAKPVVFDCRTNGFSLSNQTEPTVLHQNNQIEAMVLS